MSEKVESIYREFLETMPKEIQPFVRSLVVSRIGAHFERIHDARTGKAWLSNSELLEKELESEDKSKVVL